MKSLRLFGRRHIFAFFACNIICFSMYGCDNQPKPNGATDAATTVRVGWQVSWATQGQLAQTLEHTNALELFGLRGDFRSFTYGAPLSEAALANELDVAFVGDQPAINLVSRTSEWKLVARLMDFRVALIVPPNSQIKTVADLKGKTLGIPFGASTHRFALQMLRDAGLDPSTNVKILNIDIQEQGDVVRAGGGGQWAKVDAFASWDHHIALYKRQGLARILSSGTALGVVAMSDRFIQAHPEAAAKFLAAYKLAYYYYASHPDQANSWFAGASQGKIDASILQEVASIEPNLKATSVQQINIALEQSHLTLLQSAAGFALQQKLIQSPVDVNKVINNSLVKQADTKITEDVKSRVSAVR
jgi:ABC-type nitrate/sulfonate/bicarbonate transport system substrate-binding protein